MQSDSNLPVKQRPVQIAGSPYLRDAQGSEELSLAEVWRVVLKRKLEIFFVTLVFFALAGFYIFTATPIYESGARLQIDPSRSSNYGVEDLIKERFSSDETSSQLATQVKILESDSLASQVIKTLELSRNPDFAGKDAKPDNELLTSKMTPKQRQIYLGAFHGSLDVRVLPNSQIVEVHFRNQNPRLATDIVNAVVRAYIEKNFQTRFDGTAQVATWLSRQMEELKTEAVKAQLKLSDFQRQNGVLGADENDNIVIDRLKHINQQLTEAEADRIVKEARFRMANSGDPELIATAFPNPTLQVLRTQQADLRAQLAQLNSKYGLGYPKVRELQQQSERLDAAVATEVHKLGKHFEEEYLTASKAEAMLRGQFEEQKNRAYKLNESLAQYAILRHEVESSSALYDNLQLKLKEAGVTAGLSSSYISIVDQAEVPAGPVKPRRKITLMLGLLAGLISGLVLAFVLESLDDNLWTSEELEQISGLPVLSAIPSNVADGDNPRSRNRRPKEVIAAPAEFTPMVISNPKSLVAEAYRTLRTAVLLSATGQQSRTLVVTSCLPSEGKTTVSTNLAIALAQRGGSVLLVDADLRRSSIHKQFGQHRAASGLSTILAQGYDEQVVNRPLESMPNLHVIYAGPHPPNPAEAMASKRMAEFVARWSAEYDHVIIDTAPVLAVSDALSLSVLTDGVILVVRSGLSRKKAVLRVRDLLRRTTARIVGGVLNDVNMKLEHHYYYSYGSRYGSRYGYKGEIGYYESDEG